MASSAATPGVRPDSNDIPGRECTCAHRVCRLPYRSTATRGLGIVDTVSSGHVDLNKGLVSSLYNPVAAVPSLHMGYALIVGAVLVRFGNRRVVRAAGVTYPLLVLVVIVATGNHFFFDAATGAVVVVLAFVLSSAAGKAQGMAVLQSADAAAHREPAPTQLAA